MKHVIIDELTLANNKKALFNAGSKARNDASEIALSLGYSRVIYKSYSGLIRYILYPIQFLKLFFSIRNSEVLIQYPFVSAKFLFLFILYLKLLKCNVTLLIHDITSIREGTDISWLEKNIFNHSDKLIVHTNSMKKKLEKSNVTRCHLIVLQLFDYLTNSPLKTNMTLNKLVFAGNLDKSLFLSKLGELNVNFNLYGLTHIDAFSSNVKYKGKFAPDNLEVLDGQWGIVWDGDSLDTCNSNLGEYLRYNSPHKLSMYLAAGIPVIVWNQSALSSFIVNKGLGISISSLRDIEVVLKGFSVNDYQQIKSNVLKLKDCLRQGCFLKSCLINESSLYS